MATDHSMRYSEVKSICDSLECSPSQHDVQNFKLQPPSITPGSRSGKRAATSPTKLSTDTSEFQMTDRGRTIPQYRGKFARTARQE